MSDIVGHFALTKRSLMCVALCGLLAATVVTATDWPQMLGPERNAVYGGPAIASAWPAGGPKKVWEKRVGHGFAGPAVARGTVVLFHRVGNEEVVETLDVKTGATRWRVGYTTDYRDDFGFDEGPRAVPVVVNDRIYTFGAQGRLQSLDFTSGKTIWSVETMRRFAVAKGFFGAAGSPLVEDGRVIANIGGRDGNKGAGIVAFDVKTGNVLWTATDHEASYSSPVGATLGGRRHAVFFTRNGLVGLDPANGNVIFQRQWRSRMSASVNAATPVVIGDLIFVSAQYGTGAAVFRVKGSELTGLWSGDEALSNHYATSVHLNGYLFGFHGRQEFSPSFRAIDLKTGAVKWGVDRFGAGSVILAGNRLLIMRETGELVMAAASPDAYRVVAQAQVLPRTVRSLLALADGFFYARNNDTTNDTMECLDLR